jgi:hypothetical protein
MGLKSTPQTTSTTGGFSKSGNGWDSSFIPSPALIAYVGLMHTFFRNQARN